MVVGAHALAAHGYPRATTDLDLFIEPTHANAARLVAALAEFGFHVTHEMATDFRRPNYRASIFPEPFRIDLLPSISGVSFAAAWKGRVRARFGGAPVAFLGARELLRNRRASGSAEGLGGRATARANPGGDVQARLLPHSEAISRPSRRAQKAPIPPLTAPHRKL